METEVHLKSNFKAILKLCWPNLVNIVSFHYISAMLFINWLWLFLNFWVFYENSIFWTSNGYLGISDLLQKQKNQGASRSSRLKIKNSQKENKKTQLELTQVAKHKN